MVYVDHLGSMQQLMESVSTRGSAIGSMETTKPSWQLGEIDSQKICSC